MCISSHHPPQLIRSRPFGSQQPTPTPNSKPNHLAKSTSTTTLSSQFKSSATTSSHVAKFVVPFKHHQKQHLTVSKNNLYWQQPFSLLSWYNNNQIEIPLAILVLLFGGYTLTPPSTQSIFLNIIFPAYPLNNYTPNHIPNDTSPGFTTPNTTYFGKGLWDIAFVAYGVVLWTLLRALTISKFLKPIARHFNCSKYYMERFGEQGWLTLYYSISWSIGLYFAYLSPWWMNTHQFWIDYPHVYLAGEFKAYYLLQLSFWIQQLFVIHIEKPRKDHLQMLVHHVVTCTLLISSYCCNFTRVGAAILVTMDVGDIFLSMAKCLNYLRLRQVCDFVFVVFFGVWFYSRHVVYNVILMSVWIDIPKLIKLDWDPKSGHYMNQAMLITFTALLGILQVLLIAWFVMILRVVVKVIRGAPAEDNRSDDESDSEPVMKSTLPRASKS